MRVAISLLLAMALATAALFAAEEYSGYLVDSNCYQIASHNVDPWETSTVDRDMDWYIRECTPNRKTKSFGLVQFDWSAFRFDAAGNSMAANVVRNAGKQQVFVIALVGSREGKAINVESIKLAGGGAVSHPLKAQTVMPSRRN